MTSFRSFVALCALGMTCATEASAQTSFDAVKQFSSTRNPHGAWSYVGYGGLLKTKLLVCGNSSLPGWWDGQGEPNSVYVARNISSGPISSCVDVVAPTDHLWFDPEGDSVSVRWTAPAAGRYSIKGDFLGIATDQNSHPVEVVQNGKTVLFSGTIASYNQKLAFTLERDLKKGATIDFETADGGNYTRLSTGIAAHITLVAVP